jgi:Carboxypeptidase regulatory-like domain
MTRTFVVSLIVLSTFASHTASAQTGDGSLRGYVKDEQGGILPGVTVTATSPALLAPVVAVTDTAGYYRVNNLPPGTYMLSAELTGFAVYKREGILMRAGSTFSVDIEMTLSSVQESVTVTGESPMIETSKPTSTLNIQGELLRAAPVTSRRLFSDVLDMAPGVSSRNVDDGVGRRAYYFHGAVIFSHVFQIEGAPASSFLDSSAHSMGMGGDAIADSELKLGGVDASAPMGTGVVMNVMTPSGGNNFKGSASYDYQSRDWNSDNTNWGQNPGGLPTIQSVKQYDLALGGPIARDKVWFFATFRHANLTNGISRSQFNLTNLQAFQPGFEPFDNFMKSNQPFVKITAQLKPSHQLSGFYQGDRARYTSNRELDTNLFQYNSTGGGLYQGKLNSVWNSRLTTQVSASYNNKSGNDIDTYDGVDLNGPQITVHNDIFINRGIPTGTGVLVQKNTPTSISISPSSMIVLRGDLTYFHEAWGGSHEFKTGIYAAPRLNRDTTTNYVNNGFDLQEERQIDPSNPAAGTVVWHERFRTPAINPSIIERDSDIAFYAQDAWKPHPRVTANIGLRIDRINRHDELLNIDRERSTAVQPRLGVAYLVTADAKNVLRASYARLFEQVNGRDYIVQFGNTGGVTTTEVYTDKSGVKTTIVTPPTRTVDPRLLFDEDLHQPWADEFVLGFRKQFPGQFSVDVGATRRIYHDQFEQVDINGRYPSGPFQAFGGFGLIDPNQGIIYKETNGNWTRVVVSNLEGTIAKNMSHNFQMVLSLTRQWQHLEGTWNPTDPARFIQPDAFANDRDLSTQLFGNGDHNTLDGRGRESGAAYRPYSVRLATQYFAPWNISIGASYVIQAGGYVGPLVTRIAAADPVFGPGTVTLANGTTQSNPLAATIRFCGATALPCISNPSRSDGQVINDTAKYLQLKLGRVFKFAGGQSFEPAMNVFNAFNTGANTQWNTGANQLYNPGLLQPFNRHPPRALQLSFAYKF